MHPMQVLMIILTLFDFLSVLASLDKALVLRCQCSIYSAPSPRKTKCLGNLKNYAMETASDSL